MQQPSNHARHRPQVCVCSTLLPSNFMEALRSYGVQTRAGFPNHMGFICSLCIEIRFFFFFVLLANSLFSNFFLIFKILVKYI